MTAFRKAIISFSLLFTFFWFFRFQKSDMTIMYPDNCIFTIDKLFSKLMQVEIKNFIDNAYKKNKVPSDLLPKIESSFPSIKSIIIDMQNPEILHFRMQAHEPIFLLNNEYVVCKFGKLFPIAIFSQESLAVLEKVYFDEVPTEKNIERLLYFFQLFTDRMLRDFTIRWIGKHMIWLDQKQQEGLSLLVDYQYVPTLQDIAQCRNLRGQIIDKPCKDKQGKLCKNKVTWVCDLRFDQQIVLFSTNKGV